MSTPSAGHAMANAGSCFRSLRLLHQRAWPLRQSLTGRCIRSLECASADAATPAGQRRQLLTQALNAGRCGSSLCSGLSGEPAAWRSQQLKALPNMIKALSIGSSRRQMHASTVCMAKKKNAEVFVKRISKDDVEFSFSRSGGAGGQNVNKVNTKVDLRMNVDAAGWLDEDMKEELKRKEKNRVNKEGELVVNSSRSRTQGENMVDALDKLQDMIDAAALAVQPIEEDPVKKKKLAKQKKQANENRLKTKKLKSMKKGDRKANKRVDF